LTHPHDDHLVGLLEVLRRYEVDHVLESGYAEETPAYREWCRLIDEQGVDRILASRDQKIDLGQGIALEIIHPPVDLIAGTEQDANNNSVTLRLEWKNISFLFAGDLCSEGENSIIHQAQSREIASTVLKVPHHGSNGSTSARFLDAVDPDVAVICVGTGNLFGHPGAELLARLGDIPVYRTDLHGSISFVTDGERLWVEVGLSEGTGRGPDVQHLYCWNG
jgi:competence protein ComEC